jgi:HTH-type transcriptional regulator, competence development regulator
MKLDYPKEWFERSAELEGDSDVSAGGGSPWVKLKISNQPRAAMADANIKPLDTRIALGTFVELWRRDRGWDAIRLAEAAGVSPAEILEIERNPQSEPEASAVYRLAEVFKMPSKILMELAGLIEPRTPSLRQAAVRFAARSESVAKLTPHEREAFEAFVAAISETAGK